MNKVINISSNGIKQAIDDLVNENELLQDKIYKQNEEIERLKEELEYTIPIVEHNKTITKHLKEIERLNNIINELEKWCLSWKENDKYCYLASNDKDKCRYDIWEEVLNKLQELKGVDKE